VLEEPENENAQSAYMLSINKRFDFSAKLARMSVVTTNTLSGVNRVFVKGAPEKLKELCIKNTIPGDFDEVLNDYT